ncbi:MAG: maleylacetate reductase [Steroidobacteraceae bacterium]
MQPFTYTGLPSRVVFGFGTLAKLAEEIRALGCSRALLLCTPRQTGFAQRLAEQLGELCAGVFSDATMHTPIEVTERALQVLQTTKADCTVALGGGSTTGLGKALALRTDVKQIVIPTTYAGSEATPVVGQTQNGVKVTQGSPAILPEVIIYDVELTLTLPVAISAASGMNAIAHAVEALYARDANPLTSSQAVQAIQALGAALPRIKQNPQDADARASALYGAWLCGMCLSQVGMAMHHKLCHTLGGSFNLPHAQTHTVLLPHVVAYNTVAAPQAMQQIAHALQVENAAQGLFDLATQLGAPTSLQAIGMQQADLGRAAELAVANPYWNPRSLEQAAIHTLLENAFYGRRPVTGQ